MAQIKLAHSTEYTQKLPWLVGWVVLVVVESVGLLAPVRAVGEQLMVPVQHISYQAVQVVLSPFEMTRDAYKSARRIQDLEQRYSEAVAQLAELEGLRDENQALKQLLENTDRNLEPATVATPILSLSVPAVAAGDRENIHPGQMVLVNSNLVGSIESVSEHQSQVVLLNSSEHPPVLATTQSGVEGLLKGDGRQILLTEIPIEADVQVGEKVVTLGQVGIKRDIFIGQVAAIRSVPASPVKVAIINQVVSFYDARVVEIK
ncbi:MAG TPA: rod shape-determining protein MreC [Vitreimonas sp.]|nr:rod shape-determining protein MreC [Vitreimonas sp.]